MRKKAKDFNPYIVEIFRITTPDDWSPNFPGDQIEVKVYWHDQGIVKTASPWGRICARGQDDTLMERDFTDRSTMMALLPLIKRGGPMSKKDFLDMGFDKILSRRKPRPLRGRG